jgi:ubiquinone biosynthesis protein
MMGLAMLAERHIPGIDLYDPVSIVKEFARTIRREMDFAREGHTIEKFAANFKGTQGLYFPKVYWDRSAKGVLTLEFIDGIKVSDLTALQQAGMDQRVIARKGAETFLRMVLEHGFFHGDPHPGNVLILPDNVICLLDYGMVGRLDPKLRAYLADILMAIDKRDLDEIISILLYSGDIAESLDVRTLRRDISDFIDSYYELPLEEIEVGKLFKEFIELSATYHIKLQPDLILLAKALVTVEGMGRILDPHFDMMTILRPFMENAIKERLSPPRLTKDLTTILMSYVNLTRTLPRDIKEIIGRINRNKFKIDLEHRGLDHFIKELDKSANRVSSSMIIAALIVGSSIVMQIDKGPKLLGFPVFAFLGYSIAAIIGFWWVIAIIRSGRL